MHCYREEKKNHDCKTPEPCKAPEHCNCPKPIIDCGPAPCVLDLEKIAKENKNFRTAVWTGCYMQATVMCIPPCGEIGLEMHPSTDQILYVEEGQGVVIMGLCKAQADFQKCINPGDAVFIPACTWHNIINTGGCALKLLSFYAPPSHKKGTIHETKADDKH